MKPLLFPTAGCVAVVLLFSCAPLYQRLGGDFHGPPSMASEALPESSKSLIRQAWAGLSPGGLLDAHGHLLGLGSGGSGAFVHPDTYSWRHPVQRARFRIYLSAAGITEVGRADEQYIERLRELLRHMGGRTRMLLLALDRHYRKDGTADLDRTAFYVPNEYVVRIAEADSDLFVPVVSVHPWRKDALEALGKWADRGVRFVKWIPNTMGIDPSDPDLGPYCDLLRERGMALITHTGNELSVVAGRQDYGNPLLLRPVLDRGVTVIAAHSASFGKDVDLDHPDLPRVPSFDLFMRLFDDEKYEKRLIGDVSALIFFNHLDRPLRTLLERTDLHPRLVNGSDYPLPGLNVLIQTRRLEERRYITAGEREALNEIYRYNPLLFDFVLKRILRHPETAGRFPASVFRGDALRDFLVKPD